MSDEPYDSEADTRKHIARVGELLTTAIDRRIRRHDSSKLVDPEKAVFDRVTPRLKQLTYGSEEYTEQLKEMTHALDHHYANNRHHPEFHTNGIHDMNLMDLLEMLADWKAAGERHADGSLVASLEHNEGRFDIPPTIQKLLEDTARDLGWLDKP
jgi:hypothetical protein